VETNPFLVPLAAVKKVDGTNLSWYANVKAC